MLNLAALNTPLRRTEGKTGKYNRQEQHTILIMHIYAYTQTYRILRHTQKSSLYCVIKQFSDKADMIFFPFMSFLSFFPSEISILFCGKREGRCVACVHKLHNLKLFNKLKQSDASIWPV